MPHARRVIHDFKPYLVMYGVGGDREVFGPFAPGTEPSLEACADANRVADPTLAEAILGLASGSPELRPAQDHL
jgi:hypothetical protein